MSGLLAAPGWGSTAAGDSACPCITKKAASALGCLSYSHPWTNWLPALYPPLLLAGLQGRRPATGMTSHRQGAGGRARFIMTACLLSYPAAAFF